MNQRCSNFNSPDTSPTSGDSPEERTAARRPLLLTVQQAAEMIGVGRSTLYRIMDRGEIQSVHLGASRRIPLSAAYDFVEQLIDSTWEHQERAGE